MGDDDPNVPRGSYLASGLVCIPQGIDEDQGSFSWVDMYQVPFGRWGVHHQSWARQLELEIEAAATDISTRPIVYSELIGLRKACEGLNLLNADIWQ